MMHKLDVNESRSKFMREEDMAILMQKHDLLTMLDKQSEEWMTADNVDKKIFKNIDTLLPPTILSHADYYVKLQRQALLADTGNHEAAQLARENRKIIDYKNAQLREIYQLVKESIRLMTYTSEHATYEVYQDYVNRIKNNLVNNLLINIKLGY